jgi:hypothetical protein
MALRMNTSAILKMLMGERLYSHPGVAIRELIQNSLDACSVRSAIEPSGAYSAAVAVRLVEDDEKRHWIEVSDNGIGMDERVLSDYFFEVGNTYYTSTEFERMIRNHGAVPFIPISRFGIGVVSIFLIGDMLEVVTCNPKSVRGDLVKRYVRIEEQGGLAFVREQGPGQHGTVVRIRLKPQFRATEAVRKLEQYIHQAIIRPKYPVSVALTSNKVTLRPGGFLSLSKKAQVNYGNLEFVQLQLERFSNLLFGRVVLAFGKIGDTLVHDPGGLPMVFGSDGNRIRPFRVLDNYAGNRISVNGFLMNMKKTSRLFRSGGKRQIAFVYDVDVVGSPDVIYDVARDRIVGNGIYVVKNELRQSIERGLRETGVFNRLDPRTQKAIHGGPLGNEPEIEEPILQLVADNVPQGIWPKDVAGEIANTIKLPKKVVGRAISFLLMTGRIKRLEDTSLAPIPDEIRAS